MTDWYLNAACRGLDINLFFPDKGDAQTAKTAINYCNGGTFDILDIKGKPIGRETITPCPVRTECLNYALSFPPDQDAYGIYGGMTPHQRDKERTNRKNRIVREPQRIERKSEPSGRIVRDSARIERDPEPPPAPIAATAGESDRARWIIDDTWRAGMRELLGLIRAAMIDDEKHRRQTRKPVSRDGITS
jgi:WhiB family redox-sensing transcriptional regulator